MEVSMTQAALSAVLAIVLGMMLCIFYDVIRFSRLLLGVDVRSPFSKGNNKRGKWLGYAFVIISDFLFFVVAAVAMCIFFFLTGDGRMRGYVLFCAWLGFLLYYHTVGRLFIGVSECLVKAVKKLIKAILSVLAVPFLWMGRFIKRAVSQIFNLPIVSETFKRYNKYVERRKKMAVDRLRKKRMQKGGYYYNGGTHEKGKSG